MTNQGPAAPPELGSPASFSDLILDAAAGAPSHAAAVGRARAWTLGAAQGMTDVAPDGRLRADLRALFAGLDLALATIEERYGNG
jgi:hypothetical protein